MFRIAQWFRQDVLSSQQLNLLLARWWTTSGYPADIGYEVATNMFRFAGFVGDTETTVRPALPIEVYRGAAVGQELGLCWSLDRDVAAWFARRYIGNGKPSVLCAIKVDPGQVLGVFDGSTENEVAVDSFTLDDSRLTRIPEGLPEVEIFANERMIRRCGWECTDDPEGRQERVEYLTRENERLRGVQRSARIAAPNRSVTDRLVERRG